MMAEKLTHLALNNNHYLPHPCASIKTITGLVGLWCLTPLLTIFGGIVSPDLLQCLIYSLCVCIDLLLLSLYHMWERFYLGIAGCESHNMFKLQGSKNVGPLYR
jgi:hypothetical protein